MVSVSAQIFLLAPFFSYNLPNWFGLMIPHRWQGLAMQGWMLERLSALEVLSRLPTVLLPLLLEDPGDREPTHMVRTRSFFIKVERFIAFFFSS